MSGATKLRDLQAGTSGMMDSTAMETEEYYNQEGGESEWSQKVDTGQLCRVCANPNEYLIPIFDGEGLEHELAMKIQKHLPIKVTETDTLPLHICYQCASTLIAWHDLVISCVEADKKLRELQVEDEDEDDDKGAEMFESHSMDSDPADEVDQPSTSEVQSQVTKAPLSKKASPNKEKKPKLKMVLVKGPPAGTSGQKIGTKTQVAKVLEQAKSKEGGNEDSASERLGHPSLTSENDWERVQCVIKEEREDDDGDDSKKQNLSHSSRSFKIDSKGTSKLGNKLSPGIPDDDDIDVKEFCYVSTDVEDEREGVRKIDEAVVCKLCGKTLASRIKLMHHIRIHTDGIPARCRVCWKSFSTKATLFRHVKEVHEQVKNFKCDTCGRTFFTRQSLGIHCRTHTGDRPFVCDICAKSFTHNLSLRTHMAVHSNEKPFTCDLCQRNFKRKVDLMKHRFSHREGTRKSMQTEDNEGEFEPRLFECEHCGRILRSRGSMISHLLIHTGARPCICHVCGKHFRLSNALKRHLKEVHEQVRNHKCDTCGRMFVNQRNLEDHIRTHTGERPFVCETCGKCFKTKASLYIHNLIHKGEFPHKCSVCERRFYREADVTRHMSVHTQEKAYICDICGRGFPRNNALVRHKLVHSEATFSCSDCGHKFRQERYLRRHKLNKLKCNNSSV